MRLTEKIFGTIEPTDCWYLSPEQPKLLDGILTVRDRTSQTWTRNYRLGPALRWHPEEKSPRCIYVAPEGHELERGLIRVLDVADPRAEQLEIDSHMASVDQLGVPEGEEGQRRIDYHRNDPLVRRVLK